MKCAVASLETGGGKSVIAISPGETLTSARRRDGLLDLGDIVESLGGSYRTAEDVGTSTHDMLVVRERTDHVVGMPAEMGGLGEPAEPTAIGVYSAIETTVRRLGLDLRGLRVTIAGLGQVGSRLARALTLDGVVLSVTDLNPQRKELANELNATWIDLDGALTRPTDLLIPAGIGGVLTSKVIADLQCRAIVGPANNQLADTNGDVALAERGIIWAPDFVVNAGGAIAAILTEVDRLSAAEVSARVQGIGQTLDIVYSIADADAITPLQAAVRLADQRLVTTPVSA